MKFQEIIFDLNEYVIKKSKEGFFKGQPAARTVYGFYCHRVVVWDDDIARLKKGYVFPQSTHPVHVANCTGLTDISVRRANKWLQEGGMIEIEGSERIGYARAFSIRIVPQEDW